MHRTAFVAVVALTSFALADTDRATVDRVLAKSVADFKHCGKHPRAVLDWSAYDAIDWSKAGKDKREFLASVRASVASLGAGLDKLCADPDYSSVLGSITTIVYRPTDDRSAKLSVAITGTTLTFTDHVFGSTRGVDDFESAAQKACERANVPAGDERPDPTWSGPRSRPDPTWSGPRSRPDPRASNPGAAGRPAPASGAWDGRYSANAKATSGGVCLRPDVTGPLAVSGGRFSFPYFIDDWAEKARMPKPIKVGRVDGVVHANGTTTTTVTFGEPILRSTQVATVKIKRELGAISSVPITFSRNGGAKLAKLTGDCSAEWELPDPKASVPRSSPSSPSPSPSPRRDTKPADDAAARDAFDRNQRRDRCSASCQTKGETCRDRCSTTKDRCFERCSNMTDSDQRDQCNKTCSSDAFFCRNDCDSERETCKSGCSN
jgi:hypothetical protein